MNYQISMPGRGREEPGLAIVPLQKQPEKVLPYKLRYIIPLFLMIYREKLK
jgi:hypothetical protein